MTDASNRPIARYRPTWYALNCVAWSPDGHRLAVGLSDHTVRVLDAENGTDIVCCKGHTGTVWCVTFSPDGRRVASGSSDSTIRLWAPETGAELACLQGHTGAVWSVAFSPDGHRLASASDDNMILLWDPETGAEYAQLEGHTATVCSATFSPDGHRLASASDDNTIRLWNLETIAELTRLEGHTRRVWSVAFSPDGRRLATGSVDKTIYLWDLESGAEVARLEGHTDIVRSVVFSPDGRRLASCSWDNTIRLWDPESGAEVACLEGHTNIVRSAAFSPNGCRLASASDDGTLAIWDMVGLAEPLARLQSSASPLGRWLVRQAATVGRRPLDTIPPNQDYWVPHLEGADGQSCIGIFQSKTGSNSSKVALSPDGRRLYGGTHSGEVRAWNLNSGDLLWRVHGHTETILDLALRSDGRCLASGSYDNTIRIWDVETVSELARLEGHTDWVESVAFSSDGRRLASASDDKTIRIWDPEMGTELARLEGHTKHGSSVAFSPDGRRLASGSDDKTIRIWDAETGTELARLEGHTEGVRSVAFSPDGRRLASSSDDKTIRIWDAETGTELARLEGHTEEVRSVAFCPDGRRLASGSDDKTIRIWDAESGTELRRFSFPEDYAWHLAWAPSGAFLVSGNEGDTIRIWDTRTPEMLNASLRPKEKGTDLSPLSGERRRANGALPADLATIPGAWANLHRLGISLPLSLLRDLRALLGGEQAETLNELAAHPGIRSLATLRWPARARSGLVALLLHGWQGGTEWRPPYGTDTSELRRMLARALVSSPCEPDIPAPPLGFLSRAADGVDDRLITLLTALGPRAVMDDPALPLQLRREAPKLPVLSPPQRRLLELRVTPLDAGSAQGSGAGMDRSGFSRRGPVTALVLSQLALPEDLLLWRYLNGGLLYRTCSGQEPPQLRPVVIVLDTSPAGFGPIGALIRPAAHALADTLAGKRMPAVFLSAGDELVFLLDHPADRLRLLTHRHNRLADPVVTLNKALNLLDHLRDGPLAPVVLLLTHSHWGSEAAPPPAVHHLRALFVHYPGSSPRPPWADWCERWETLRHNQFDGLAVALGRLIG